PRKPVRRWIWPIVGYGFMLPAINCVIAIISSSKSYRADSILYVNQASLHPRVANAHFGNKLKPKNIERRRKDRRKDDAGSKRGKLTAPICAIYRVVVNVTGMANGHV